MQAPVFSCEKQSVARDILVAPPQARTVYHPKCMGSMQIFLCHSTLPVYW